LSENRTILSGLKIWDGLAGDYLPDVDSITIDGHAITSIGHGHQSAGIKTKQINCAGLYAIPGLIDAHIHLVLDPEIKDAMKQGLESTAELMLKMELRVKKMAAAGITTARDLGGGQWQELIVRDRIQRGELVGPRLVCSGQPITSPQGHCHFWGGEAETTEECLSVLERQIERGVDLIKVMATGGTMTPLSRPVDAQFDLATMTKIVERSSQHHRHVAAHCHGTSGIRNAAMAGVRTIEHCSFVGENGWGADYDELAVQEMVANDTRVSPTISFGWRRFIGNDKGPEKRVMENLARLRQAGVKLIASTDAGIPNVFHHDLPKALAVFAHFASFTPVEALRSATSDCASAIGLGDITGVLKPGFEADVVLYEKDPLADLSALEHPVAVYGRGVLLSD
jgi:imidazolonepropionase-like amidohydrolase